MEDASSKTVATFCLLSLAIVIILSRYLLGRSSTFFFIAGAGGAAITAILTGLVLRHQANRRRENQERQRLSENKELGIEYSFLRRVAGVPTKYRYRDLEEATCNFKFLLGKGASSSVFKGTLSDGTLIAVKRIDGEDGGGGGEKAFRSEVAAIASVHHVNLARLVGYSCPPNKPRFLVYDFVSNGSLDYWIFRNSGSREEQQRPRGCLSWEKRQMVALDVARALSYMHHDCRRRILHLDVKPENILLDSSHRAVVSDFGLSKLIGRDESRVMTTIRGTRGYLAPEWLLEDGVSAKSDVYSYGMVVLEMVGGRRSVWSVNRKWEYFPKIVWERMREGRIMEVVDRRLVGVEEKEVRRMVHVGLWCIQEEAKRRPSMAEVVEMLEGKRKVEQPPETEMIVVDLLSIDENGAAVGRRAPQQEMSGKATSVAACSFATQIYSGR